MFDADTDYVDFLRPGETTTALTREPSASPRAGRYPSRNSHKGRSAPYSQSYYSDDAYSDYGYAVSLRIPIHADQTFRPQTLTLE